MQKAWRRCTHFESRRSNFEYIAAFCVSSAPLLLLTFDEVSDRSAVLRCISSVRPAGGRQRGGHTMPDVLQGLLGSAACAAAPPEPASSAAATAPTTDDDNHHEATTGAEAAATAVQDHVQDADAAAAAEFDAPDRAAAVVGSLSEDKGCAASESEEMDCTCYVCLEGDDPELTELGELLRGCACRGSAGWAHLRCLVQQATANRQRFQKQQLQSMLTPVRLRDDTKNIPSLFDQCPTCNQRWTADLALKLARERCTLSASVIGRPLGASGQSAD